jgi:hypothetical protein
MDEIDKKCLLSTFGAEGGPSAYGQVESSEARTQVGALGETELGIFFQRRADFIA